MITVMVADDSAIKVQGVRDVADQAILHERARVLHAGSVAEALEQLRSVDVDILIVDLNLPIRNGEDAKRDGGVRLLESIEIGSGSSVRKPRHIVGLTAFPELLAEHAREFERSTWSLIQYDDSSVDWAERLRKKIEYIAEGHVASGFRTDVAIITALERPEMESVLDLPAEWSESHEAGDETIYFRGEFSRGRARVQVVAACCLDMGMPAATALTMKIIERYRPRYVAIVGIAAGVSGNCGDILIADQSYDYGSGKSKHKFLRGVIFEPAPIAIPLSGALKARFGRFSRRDDVLAAIERQWNDAKPDTRLAARLGPIVSGAAVLENRPLIQQIKAHHRKIVGIEMETYGVFMACRCCTELRPLAMSIKSICDFGDSRKVDKYQRYAAYTSARYLYEFALDELHSS